ncbi:hypothetical protein CEQ90_16000 [Lewinellaceae bacterium SD302]|nr:hypothetical protein CEQ90_16000 [Lewinellaceae bacterium SD302]
MNFTSTFRLVTVLLISMLSVTLTAQAPPEFDAPFGCFVAFNPNTNVLGVVNLTGACGPATGDDYIGVRDAQGFFIGSQQLLSNGQTFSVNIAEQGAPNGASCMEPDYGYITTGETVTVIIYDADQDAFYVGNNSTFVGVKGGNGRLNGPDGDANVIDTYNFDCNMQVLPVTLAGFRARVQDNGTVKIEWSTLDETNNDRFEVQRSLDGGRTFEQIGQVAGNGNSDVFNNYNFLDRTPQNGSNVYRLKQVDFDGSFEYSPIALVEIGGGSEPGKVVLYPNPVAESGQTTVSLSGNWGAGTSADLYDINGRIVTSFAGLQGGSTTIDLPSLTTGVYQMVVTDAQQREVVRLVVR